MVAQAIELKTYDFSYSLHGDQVRTFRLIAEGNEPIYLDRTKGFEGYVWIEDADGKTGHMRLTTIIEPLKNGGVIFYLPDGYVQERMQREGIVVPNDADFAEFNQFCFARKQEQWRTWDKSKREATMQYVDGYYGPCYASWHDGGGHFFGHGRKWFAEIPGKGRVAMMAGDAP